jgi:hypothetical protein
MLQVIHALICGFAHVFDHFDDVGEVRFLLVVVLVEGVGKGIFNEDFVHLTRISSQK